MSSIPENLKYTRSHEWVRVENDGSVTVGITDHAQEQLGDLVFVELPEVGAEVAAGKDCAVVESVKAASDVYAPVGGQIVDSNTALADAPETINQSPYDKGWMFRIKVADSGELDKLLDAAAYKTMVESEAD